MKLSRFRKWIFDRPRRAKRDLLLIVDFAGLMLIVWLAFCIRFETLFIPNATQALFIVAAPVITIPIFIRMGLYRSVLRYLPERAIWTIIRAVTFATLAWVALIFITSMTGAQGVPRTIPVVYWVASIVAVAGSRFGIKWLLSLADQGTAAAKRILIYGAGDAGVQLADALRSAGDRHVIGFISEDAGLHGMDIIGIRVYPPGMVEQVVTNFGIEELIVTSSTREHKRDLVARLGGLPVKIRILPAIADLAAGKYLVSYIRDIDLDDLLGRSPVPADPALVRRMIEGHTIMITGAAGSIGSALCRAIAGANPAKLILVDINEHGLYQIERELRSIASDCRISAVLGSIANPGLIRRTLLAHEVDTIYHCAAYKHVSLVEANKIEGVRNNVLGTQVLAEAALACAVDSFILISSDKAVRPTSVMGATKRWAEIIVRYYGTKALEGGRRRNFASVRFGNVIGSSGSVVPLFKEQLSAGGPVTITHNDMTRYFMSVREAAELIIQAGALSESGDILMLDMGEPVRIRDLAEDMIMLAGLTVRDAANPDGDIEIVTIGAREGEKLREELFYDPSGVVATLHPKILRARRMDVPNDAPARLEKLRAAIDRNDEDEVRSLLFDFIDNTAELVSPLPSAQPGARVAKSEHPI